jgi:AcrR family transcriptional regulator
MRIQDENKKEAIFKATVKLVNEIGFVSSSVAKIAKEANVSPATIYIYYKNKEDLLTSTYLQIKRRMGKAMLKDFNENDPVRDIFYKIWLNTSDFIYKHPELANYAEQFQNSPYYDSVDSKEAESSFEPILKIIEKGIKQKILKDVNLEIIGAFIYYPVFILSNPRRNRNNALSRKNAEKAFQLAWDAIKL